MNKDKSVFYSKLWNLMIPIVLQNLMLALVAVADAFMLGGMDQNYMSAVSLATQIQFIQNMFLSAATASLGILGAQYWGKGDIKTLDEIFCMALRLCGLVSVVFFAACVFGGRYLINGLPISSDPPLDAETEETSEPPYDTEEIRFESADDIPGYERAGCYDEYEHSLIPGADSGKAGPLFTQRLRDGKPVSVVRIKITSANSWDEMNYTEYHAVITECLSGKQLNLNISNEVTFRLGDYRRAFPFRGRRAYCSRSRGRR